MRDAHTGMFACAAFGACVRMDVPKEGGDTRQDLMGKSMTRSLRPHAGPVRGNGKVCSAHVAVDYDQMQPVFSLLHIDDVFGLGKCQPDDLRRLLEKMAELGEVTWSHLKQAPRHGIGMELIPVARLCRPRPSCLPPHVDRLIAFRFHGKASMLGFRDRNVFYICFLDPKFELYRHG
jgi:hypothetical protein